MSRMSSDYLADLGVRVGNEGFERHRGEVMALVVLARAGGVTGPATDVLGDWAAAEVVRYRAFARVSAALAGLRSAVPEAVERAA